MKKLITVLFMMSSIGLNAQLKGMGAYIPTVDSDLITENLSRTYDLEFSIYSYTYYSDEDALIDEKIISNVLDELKSILIANGMTLTDFNKSYRGWGVVPDLDAKKILKHSKIDELFYLYSINDFMIVFIINKKSVGFRIATQNDWNNVGND